MATCNPLQSRPYKGRTFGELQGGSELLNLALCKPSNTGVAKHSLKVQCGAEASKQASTKLPAPGPSCGGRSWEPGVGSRPTSCPAARAPPPLGAGGQGFYSRVSARVTPVYPGRNRNLGTARGLSTPGSLRGRGRRRSLLGFGGGTDGGRGRGWSARLCGPGAGRSKEGGVARGPRLCGRGGERAVARGGSGRQAGGGAVGGRGRGPKLFRAGQRGWRADRAGPEEKFSLRLLSEGAGPRKQCTPAAMAFRRRTKSYPLFSQEFVIHNHADIGFCLVLCVLIGLMFEVSRAGRGTAGAGGPISRTPR